MLSDALRRHSAIPSAAVLLLLFAACGPWPSPATGPDLDRSDQSLRVWLSDAPDARPSPFTVFHVNRPAYVAIFDIRPGAGVKAVYPWAASGSGRPVSAGLRSVLPFGFAHGFRSHGFGASFASFASFGACAAALHSPVVWRLIIASERPLDLERLVGDVAFNFRPAIHARSFAFGTAFDIMDAIVSRAVPGALTGGELAGGGQWDVYWTSGWAAPACDRPLPPLPRLVLTDPYPDEDASETADDDAEDGVDGEDAEVVDGFRVPVTTDRPAVAWKGPPQEEGASGTEGESSAQPPAPPALLRGPETRTRSGTPRLVDWRRQTGPSLDLRDRDRSWDRDRDFRIRSRRWGHAGRGIRFRPANARPDRGSGPDRVDPPSPVRRSPAPRPMRRSSPDDDDRADEAADRGGSGGA